MDMIRYQKKKRMKSNKSIAVIVGLMAFSWLSLGFGDKYFELSKNLDIFSTLFKELNTYYVDETEPGQLMKTAIDGMLKSLDPYTNYIPESQIEDFRFMTTGQYGGIGALIHKNDGKIFLSEPYEGFPAYKSDLKAGDVILSIDGNSVDGKSTADISEFLKGQPGTALTIEIERTTKDGLVKMSKEVVRENIKIDDVPYFGMINDRIGYIKLTGFTQTASKEFISAFKSLKSNGMQELIFDLRGNGGGLLIEAVKIVNVFVPKGSLVVETKGKRKEWDAKYTAQSEPLDTEIPLTILVNEGSASASEIVCGALQDYDRAVVIGKQTFGKGLVQQTRPLSYNSQLKVTVAKYYIPSGRCIQRIDYSHKNNAGLAEDIPDSLIKKFKTLKHNREVRDGKGIKPDFLTSDQMLSPLSVALLRYHHIFDFANKYQLKHDSIQLPNTFDMSDDEYQSFVSYLADKDIEYTSKSEQLLEELKEVAKNEKYYEDAKEEYLALAQKFDKDKVEDLELFKTEIEDILENEIVSRYYYQDGRIEHSLASDTDILKAKSVLMDKTIYNAVLTGTLKE